MDPPNSGSPWHPEISTSMSEAFHRLRWSVFEPISYIRVADSPYGTELSPFENHPIAAEPATEIPVKAVAFQIDTLNEYDPLLDDGESSEEESDYGDEEGDEGSDEDEDEESDEDEDEESDEDEPRYYKPPRRLIATREDGGIVTVGDVVEQLEPYNVKRKEKILESRIGFITMGHGDKPGGGRAWSPARGSSKAPLDTRVAFEGFEGMVNPERYAVHAMLWTEGEDAGKSLEEHWNYGA